jgi:photosystem II stability/assembly factor-like uncharacterized protein
MRCVAVGEQFPLSPKAEGIYVVTSDGGATWHSRRVRTGDIIDSVDCLTDGKCVGVAGEPVFRSSDSGASWSRQVPDNGALTRQADFVHVSCVDANKCAASSNSSMMLYTRDGGESWQISRVPEEAATVLPLSCAATGYCVAVSTYPATAFYGSADSGATWQLESTLKQNFDIGAVRCLSNSRCIAVGMLAVQRSRQSYTYGAILLSLDGGQTWRTKVLPPSYEPPMEVACPSQGECVAIGGNVLWVTDDGGSNWRAEVVSLPKDASLDNISCRALDRCVATALKVDTGGATTTAYLLELSNLN